MKVLEVNNISKVYRLGEIGTGTISHDINRWAHKILGKDDPYQKITQTNKRSGEGQSDYVYALNDINFSVNQGEIVGIIGRNGAGKSTLLKILSRITAPSTGSVKTKGKLASLLEVGTGMHPEMTARENIYLNGAILGMTKQEISAKFDEIVEFSGCKLYVDTPIKRFSSGMTVRLGFAVAAFLEPEILIVDEVLAVGDAEFQKKAIGKMKDVSSSGSRTVLFVSHNMASVKSICNRTIVVDEGSIVFDGNTDEAITHYLNLNDEEIQNKNLDERTDRVGGDHFKFTNLQILRGQQKSEEPVSSGDNVTFRLHYTSDNSLKNIIGRIVIKKADGTEMTTLNNFHCDTPFSSIPTKGYFDCTIENLPLFEGNYILDIACIQDLSILDSIENAHEFVINEGDFYGTGKIPINKNGFMLKNKWSVGNEE